MPSSSATPALPPVAQPMRAPLFDPWHSSSTGHQQHRPSGRGATSWRDVRTQQLNRQLGARGPAARASRAPSRSVAEMLAAPGSMAVAQEAPPRLAVRPRALFDGVVVYVNGSTFPLISDHRLKQLLSEHGARTAMHLGRRAVTHVVLGRPVGGQGAAGAGGGLAGGKMEREIRRTAGCGVRFVSVEWVLESVKAGKRLPEARFAAVKMAGQAQRSVYALYSAHGDGKAEGTAGEEA